MFARFSPHFEFNKLPVLNFTEIYEFGAVLKDGSVEANGRFSRLREGA